MIQARLGNQRDTVRILIVDDDRRVRQSLAGLISLREGLSVVGATGDVDRVLELVTSERPDVVLVDLAPSEDPIGVALLRQLSERWPALVLVAMSVCRDGASTALAAGADAFISKDSNHEEIGEALAALFTND